MKGSFEKLLNKSSFSREEIVDILHSDASQCKILFKKAAEIKQKLSGKKVHLRGLVEFSNICTKNCFYCGIREGNREVKRYNLSDEEIINAVRFVNENRYGSLVLQSGEIQNPAFTERISTLLKKISSSNTFPGITLSLGEQSEETYRQWFRAGASRYLLRIETSDKKLYQKIHPNDENHDYEKRKACLLTLKEIGYQTGTGFMVGLPYQSVENIADDILFMKKLDMDMVGLGPYIEHADTPLYSFREQLAPLKERFFMCLKTIAVLRILMKDINIAAATALQSIDKNGREKALLCGANIIMPNVTPGHYRNLYKLYDNKACVTEEPGDCIHCLEAKVALTGNHIAYGERGDSLHYFSRQAS